MEQAVENFDEEVKSLGTARWKVMLADGYQVLASELLREAWIVKNRFFVFIRIQENHYVEILKYYY